MSGAGRFRVNGTVEEPGRIQPGVARAFRRWCAPLVRLLFRPRMEGLENLPTDRPCMLVANHSAGVGLAELLSLATCWLENGGEERRMAGFAHPLGFRIWPTSALHRELGTVPSTYEDGREALARGASLLVFPGGDHESLKPVWQNMRVDFGGRLGFLRLAREMNVPVVPLGIRNGALTAPVLVRARWLAWGLVLPRLVGVKRWGISLLGVVVAVLLWLALPFAAPVKALALLAWLTSPLVFLPVFPATLRMRIGAPIMPEDLFPDGGGEVELREALTRVQGAVQEMVHQA